MTQTHVLLCFLNYKKSSKINYLITIKANAISDGSWLRVQGKAIKDSE